ncbi:MAG: ribulose-phosphate 3-epimerase [Puniceicoccales bacterium]|jgi:ribulose-phosphate 3-epimerase|nr:ribulose-phosphate 3-epimerase [Puniceicoccales bacterium]
MANSAPLLAPSLLAGNHAALRDSLSIIENAGLEWVHLDIMDGHFVPNLSFGPQTLSDLRPNSKLFFDTHLMLSEPHRYIEPFAKAGAQRLTIHIEPDYPHLDTLRKIKSMGVCAGIALNPNIPAERVKPLLGEVDLVLAMTVFPGFGGQSFISSVLDKIKTLAEWRSQLGLNFRIEVDGGINIETGLACRQAGADALVAGTSFFKAPDKAAFIKAILA